MSSNPGDASAAGKQSRAIAFLRYWLPALVWMCLIFTASTGAGSFQHSSRIIAPIVRWLFPHASDDQVHQAVYVVRKCAHVTEYAILALLLWRALRKPGRRDPRPWSWVQGLAVVLLVLLYAASDEFHQVFVPGRQASVWDVMLDTCGGVLAVMFLRALHWIRKKRA